MTLPERCDVVVVGAGPAGLAAAVECARAGAATVVLDEQAGPGGQIYRGITVTPMQKREILGDDYWHGATLVSALQASAARYVPRASVFAVTAADGGGFEVGVSGDGTARADPRRARHRRHRRAGAAVPDSRLDAAGRR